MQDKERTSNEVVSESLKIGVHSRKGVGGMRENPSG